MQIDPLEAVIVWLREALTTVNGRVAAKHRYGEAWSENQMGVSVHLDGGTPDIYAEVAKVRLEIRIYSNDQKNVVAVWRELTQLNRTAKRFAVNTSLGTALVHYVLPETSLSLLYHEQLKKDMGVVFMAAMVSEDSVGS